MNQVLLTDFRCFAGTHTVPVRPLTLLVGENSSGKTSFLAAVRAAFGMIHRAAVDFNEDPYQLGAFDELSNYRGGKAGRADCFKIGYGEPLSRTANETLLIGTFRERNAQPFLCKIEIALDANRIVIAEQVADSKWIFFTSVGRPKPHKEYNFLVAPGVLGRLLASEILDSEPIVDALGIAENELDELRRHLLLLHRRDVFAAAPIRAEPRRTYEITSDQPKSHGSHIPVLLSQLYGKDDWDIIQGPLVAFAKSAGLFNSLSIKRLGNKESSPFQIHVKLNGPARNIIDVGYGVSQALPLLVEILRRRKGCVLLLQQPEVHLHPRAQAALGSLFGSVAVSDKKQFFVETHSDYIVDRVRMDVRDKKAITKDDVVILFFENTGKGTKIHPIFLDELGNLIDAPPTYRQFFLQEERRFLGF